MEYIYKLKSNEADANNANLALKKAETLAKLCDVFGFKLELIRLETEDTVYSQKDKYER
jgi:hypothetical protein|tara:strand:+ start:45 stop:221 length:177 start_codon:yes stop_codon:yes gene_type:complete